MVPAGTRGSAQGCPSGAHARRFPAPPEIVSRQIPNFPQRPCYHKNPTKKGRLQKRHRAQRPPAPPSPRGGSSRRRRGAPRAWSLQARAALRRAAPRVRTLDPVGCAPAATDASKVQGFCMHVLFAALGRIRVSTSHTLPQRRQSPNPTFSQRGVFAHTAAVGEGHVDASHTEVLVYLVQCTCRRTGF